MSLDDLIQLSDLYGVETAIIESVVNIEVDHQPEKLHEIMVIAIDYFRTEESAKSWFSSVNRGLGSVTPLSLLGSDVGIERVKSSINKLMHGMTA